MTDPAEVVQLVKRRTEGPILDPRDPLQSARAFIEARHMHEELHTLHRHRGEFFVWVGNAYRVADEDEIRAELYEFLDSAWRLDGKEPKPFQPNRSKVNDVLDALRAEAHLSLELSPPTWLEAIPDLNGPPEEYLSVANGLLHLPTRELLVVTPAFFATSALPVAYDPDAPDPVEWLRFLRSLWPDDPEALETLQELFGYALTPDTRQQKIFLLVGPKRSGKGTIARTLTSIVGAHNTASPTLGSLGQNFGLAPLINKRVATITDARLGGRADQAAIAERLLAVSGEDSQTVDRKFLPAWSGRMSVKFVILTNELPRIADASGALASRFIVLMLMHSFYGREDLTLSDRISAELSGILQWAIDGLDRLHDRGHFRQPASARDTVEELEGLGAPVAAFIRDRCIVAPASTCAVDSLFEAWRSWCDDNGRREPGTKQTFGRDLRAAVSGIKTVQARDGDARHRTYEGIGLQ